jgi:carnitine monooxygenase subunit
LPCKLSSDKFQQKAAYLIVGSTESGEQAVLEKVTNPQGTVPFKVTNPERIPTPRYYHEDFFKLEGEHLWPHVWQMACRLEEIPKVGDWVEYRILGQSVIVVQSKSGVKAYHNACRHRGVKVAEGHGNCASGGFVCPFHGWRYNMDGENIFMFGRQLFSEENAQKADLALAPCRVELWGGCAFINFDDSAPPLLECLGPVTERLDARNVEKLKVDWWHSTVLPTNWKLAMEAFMEGFHVMRTHPQLHALSRSSTRYGTDGSDAPSKVTCARESVETLIRLLAKLREGMGGMIDASELAIAESLRDMELPDDTAAAGAAFFRRLRDEITSQGRARGLPVPDLNKVADIHPFDTVEFVFPHYFLLPMFSAMASYRVRPLTPETCLFEIWSLALYPDDEQRPAPIAPLPGPYDDPNLPEIPRQDYYNLPLQQLGLHAKGFEYMRLACQAEGMISNYQRLIDGYLEGVEPNRLAKASRVVCSGYNSPILDIGI